MLTHCEYDMDRLEICGNFVTYHHFLFFPFEFYIL